MRSRSPTHIFAAVISVRRRLFLTSRWVFALMYVCRMHVYLYACLHVCIYICVCGFLWWWWCLCHMLQVTCHMLQCNCRHWVLFHFDLTWTTFLRKNRVSIHGCCCCCGRWCCYLILLNINNNNANKQSKPTTIITTTSRRSRRRISRRTATLRATLLTTTLTTLKLSTEHKFNKTHYNTSTHVHLPW